MAGVVSAVLVPLFLGSYDSTATVVGVSIAIMQVGILGGSLAAGAKARTLGPRYPVILGLAGLFTACAGLTPFVGIAIVSLFAFGITNGIILVHNRSVLQRETPASERAGTIALLMAVGAVATTIGAIGGGALAEHTSPRDVVTAAGVFGVLVIMPAALLTRPRP
jgi:MFS family permease